MLMFCPPKGEMPTFSMFVEYVDFDLDADHCPPVCIVIIAGALACVLCVYVCAEFIFYALYRIIPSAAEPSIATARQHIWICYTYGS
jgi:hypothetical protein